MEGFKTSHATFSFRHSSTERGWGSETTAVAERFIFPPPPNATSETHIKFPTGVGSPPGPFFSSRLQGNKGGQRKPTLAKPTHPAKGDRIARLFRLRAAHFLHAHRAVYFLYAEQRYRYRIAPLLKAKTADFRNIQSGCRFASRGLLRTNEPRAPHHASSYLPCRASHRD